MRIDLHAVSNSLVLAFGATPYVPRPILLERAGACTSRDPQRMFVEIRPLFLQL